MQSRRSIRIVLQRAVPDGLLPAALYVAVALWFGRAWLDEGLPSGDFGGNVAYQWHLKQSLAETGRPPVWSQYWFCGQPLTVVQPGPWFLPFMQWLDPIQSIKVGCLVYFGLSGWLMYVLLLYLTGSRAAAYLGGLVYAIHPIHVSVTAWTGHPNFGPFYLWPPLLLLALIALARGITYSRGLLLALVVAAMAVSDVERMVTVLLPALVGAAVYARCAPMLEPQARADHFWRYTGAVAVACAGAVVLSLWFLGPVVAEQAHMTLFSPEIREESVHYFSMQNPVHLIDRGGWLVGRWARYLPGEFVYNKGFIYLGLVPLAFAGCAWAFSRTAEHRRLLLAVLAVSLVGIWIAGGMYSVFDRLGALATALFRHPQYLEQRSLEIPLLAAVLLVGLAAWAIVQRRNRPKPATTTSTKALMLLGLLALFVFISPSLLFQHVPFLCHMRSPSWFMSFAPSLGLCLAAGLLPAVMRHGGWSRTVVAAATLAGCGMYVADALPYREAFRAIEPPAVTSDLKRVAAFLAERRAEERQFRVMARETYNPTVETQVIWSKVPVAWSWLNWASPKAVGQLFLEEIYPKLHHPETITEAVRLAGVAGVKYLIYDLTEGPRAPPCNLLDVALETEHFVVYRNQAFRPLVQFLPGDAPESEILWPNGHELNADHWQLQRPSDTEIHLKAIVPSDGTLMVSEAWYPGWTVEVDGHAQKLHRVQRAFQGVRLAKGTHEVRFAYTRPRYVATSAAISGFGLFIGLLLAPFQIRHLVFECVREALSSVCSWAGRLRSRFASHPRRVEAGAFTLLLLAAGTVRLYNLADNPLWYPDEVQHVMMAKSILTEGSARDQAMRISWIDSYHPYPPGLDLSIAAMMLVVGKHVLAARLVTAILTIVTVAAVILTARQLAGRIAAWTAGLAIAFHPLTVLFHRWGFASAAAGTGAVVTFWLAMRLRQQPTRKRFYGALTASFSAVAFSYWSFPIVVFVLYVAWTANRKLTMRCLTPLAGAAAVVLLVLAVTGKLTVLVDRADGIAQVVRSSHEGQTTNIGTVVKSALAAYRTWLAVDWLLAMGTLGILFAPKGWPRRDLLVGFLLLGSASIFMRADLMAAFFYNALIFVPLVFVGLGCLVARLANWMELIAQAIPRADVRVLRVASAVGGIMVCALLLGRTAWANHFGWKTPVDVYCVTDPTTTRQIAGWINEHTDKEEFIIGSTPIGSLLDCRIAPAHHVTARAGLSTTWMVEPPAPDRFAFDCSAEKARFLWVDNHFRAWSVWQENFDLVLHQIEQEGWPLVYQQGEDRVYANPRFWDGEVLAERPLVIGVPSIYRRLADRLMQQERYDDALAAYDRLLHLVPEDAGTTNNAAVAAARLERWNRARALWRRTLELDPEFLAARQGLEAIHGRTLEASQDENPES